VRSICAIRDQGGVTLPNGDRVMPDPVLIGRNDDCQVPNTDPSVSRHHARLDLRDDGRYYVTDLGSTNGTFVNDRRVTRLVLAQGDRVRVGRVQLEVTRDS
jgi:pSer/pThr/pTyr-binding forkhead associated (FHA) protein